MIEKFLKDECRSQDPLRVFHDFVEGLSGSCSVTGRQGFASARPINYVESSISCGFVKFVVLLICVRKAFVFRVPHLRCSAWYESSGCEIQNLTNKGLVGFECFGYKKVKLYIVAKKMNISAYFPEKLKLERLFHSETFHEYESHLPRQGFRHPIGTTNTPSLIRFPALVPTAVSTILNAGAFIFPDFDGFL